MKIIKTIGKYVKNGFTRLLSVFTTDYNVYSLEQSKYIDEVIAELVNKVDVLTKFCQPIKHPWGSTSTADLSHIGIYTIGNACYINGELYFHFEASGSHSYRLPDNLAPSSKIRNYSPIIIDGEQYNMHYEIDADSDRLNLYFYDPIPADKAIPLEIAYNLSTAHMG